MMDIKTSSQPPPGGILRFFPTVGKMNPDKRECCADAFFRMVSDSPPGHPKSCSAPGAQCPFQLARPVGNTSASNRHELPEIVGNKAIILTGLFSAMLIMTTVFVVGGVVVIRSMLRRRYAGGGGGGGGSTAPTIGDHSSEPNNGTAPGNDEETMPWEVSYASLLPEDD